MEVGASESSHCCTIRAVKGVGNIHTEDRVETALLECEQRRSGTSAAILEIVGQGLLETPSVLAACAKMEGLERDAFVSLAAHQILVDLTELVLPKIWRSKKIPEVLSTHLSYEVFDLGPATFLRWIIGEPQRFLKGHVDQQELARTQLPDRIRRFSAEMQVSRGVQKYHAEQFAEAGLSPVRTASDLTADHVLLMGAMLTVAGYHLIPGQSIHPLARRVYRRQWKALTNEASRKAGVKHNAHQKTQYGTRGYGFPMAPLAARARRDAKPHVLEQRRREAAERSAAREAYEAAKQQRREQARARQHEAAAAAALQAEHRAATQRKALSNKSRRDRERWEQARAAQEAAAAAIDLRNKELLADSKRDAKKRKAQRARDREEHSRAAEIERQSILDAQLGALPTELQDMQADALIKLLKRDARSADILEEDRTLVALWDQRLHSPDWELHVDPDFRDTVETWLRNGLPSDDWLAHLEKRLAAHRKRAAELRILEARRIEERRQASLERAAALEAARIPGTGWSEHLRFLETLTTEERIERLKGCGCVGPPAGFSTLERHLHGQVTDRERQNYGRERWMDIGSAFAELRTLERLTFYGVNVRFARELPGVLNPDFLIIDTLEGLGSVARIRPLEVKKIYLDRAEDGRSCEENATHYFGLKLEKASRQLAEGMRRYGNDHPRRREDGLRNELGGTALFVAQSRSPELLVGGRLHTICEQLRLRLLDMDSGRSIEAVDCVLVVLDYVDGERFQRPIMALHRASQSTPPPEQDAARWTNRHTYIDYLTSEHNVRRPISSEALYPS